MRKYNYKKGDLYKYVNNYDGFVTIEILHDTMRTPRAIVIESSGLREVGYESASWDLDYFTKIKNNRPNIIKSLLNIISI